MAPLTSAVFIIPVLVAISLSSFENAQSVKTHMKEIETLFAEIGFSPSCVAKSLALCENSKDNLSLADTQSSLQAINNSVQNFLQTQSRPRNCAELFKSGGKESGVRPVYPYSCCDTRPVSVYCDQTTDGGGWTVIQHRETLPNREDFFRTWVEYRLGFGNLSGEFWLGLDNIHALVSKNLMELRVDLEDFEGQKRWAKYEHFYISDASDKFRLSLGKYSGDAGDSFSGHNGNQFTTRDQDNDVHGTINCANDFKGAWWYGACHSSNLNGFQHQRNHTSYADGINWYAYAGHHYSLKTTSLGLRPKFS